MTIGEIGSEQSITQRYAHLWRIIDGAPTPENADFVSGEAAQLLKALQREIPQGVERSLVFSSDRFYDEFKWINGAYDELVSHESSNDPTAEVSNAYFTGRIANYDTAELTGQRSLDDYEAAWLEEFRTKNPRTEDGAYRPDWIRTLTKQDYTVLLDDILAELRAISTEPVRFGQSADDDTVDTVVKNFITASDIAICSGSPEVITHFKQKLANLNAGIKDKFQASPSIIATADMLYQKVYIDNKPLDQIKELLQFVKEEDPEQWQGVQEILTYYMLTSVAAMAIRNYESLNYNEQQRVKNNLLLRFQLSFLKNIGVALQHAASTPELPASVDDVLKETELDWAVLPKGEDELRKSAEEIVTAARQQLRDGAELTIDLERLQILTEIRHRWGEDMCYFARGKLKRGSTVVSEDGTRQPDEYIVLVLQEYQDGVLVEHAVAESPIAGPNALYVCRADVSPKPWRDVYSIPKKDARALGARRIKHTCAIGESLIEVMANKVETLLTATPEEFARLQFTGRHKGCGVRIIDLVTKQT